MDSEILSQYVIIQDVRERILELYLLIHVTQYHWLHGVFLGGGVKF